MRSLHLSKRCRKQYARFYLCVERYLALHSFVPFTRGRIPSRFAIWASYHQYCGQADSPWRSVSIHTSFRCQNIAQYDNFVRDGNFLHHVLCSVPGFWSSYHVLFGACNSSNAFSRPASPYSSDPDSLRTRRITHGHSALSQVITIYSRVRSCDIR
jgi:hypothetical protein